MLTSIIVASILAFVFMYVRVTQARVYGLITKTIASLAFVAVGIVGVIFNEVTSGYVLIVLGAVFGLVGDVFLDLKRTCPEHHDVFMLTGMVSFGIGHIIYFAALTILATSLHLSLTLPLILAAIIAPIIAIVAVLGAKTMGLDYGKFKIPAAIYACMLGFMAVYAMAIAFQRPLLFIVGAGMLFFLASDLVLSKQYFGGKADSKLLTVVNHTLYYAAQIAIGVSLFFA